MTAWNRPLVVALVVFAFAVLTLYPQAPADAGPAKGRVLFKALGVNLTTGDVLEAPFPVAANYTHMNLSYDFAVAIYPEVWWTDPHGRTYEARAPTGDTLDLTVQTPLRGVWSFHMRPDPDRPEARIENANLYVLGFGATTDR